MMSNFMNRQRLVEDAKALAAMTDELIARERAEDDAKMSVISQLRRVKRARAALDKRAAAVGPDAAPLITSVEVITGTPLWSEELWTADTIASSVACMESVGTDSRASGNGDRPESEQLMEAVAWLRHRAGELDKKTGSDAAAERAGIMFALDTITEFTGAK